MNHQLASSTVPQQFSTRSQHGPSFCRIGLGLTTVLRSPDAFGPLNHQFLTVKTIPYSSLLSSADGSTIPPSTRHIRPIYKFRPLRVGNSLLWNICPSFGLSLSHDQLTDFFASSVIKRIASPILHSRLPPASPLESTYPPTVTSAPFISPNSTQPTGLLSNANSPDVRDGVFNDVRGGQTNTGHGECS